MAVIVKERIWPRLHYEPHALQREVHNSLLRHRLVAAGRRWGKSQLGGHELTPHALYAHTIAPHLMETGQQKRFWIVGPNYEDAEREWRVFYQDVKRTLKCPVDHPGTYNDVQGGNMAMSLWDGRFIVECKSAAHPESLDGEGLDGVLLVEAAKLKSTVWSKFIRPALADKRGWSLATSTPEGRNWFYDHWVWGQDPKRDTWYSLRAPSWTNTPTFPGGRNDPEILAMTQDMSVEKFNQEIGAEFTEHVGRVFKRFEEEIHVRNLDYNPKYPLYLAVDYGFTNPFVALLIQEDVWGTVHVLAEYRRTRMDINDIADELKRWRNGAALHARYLYPDPAEPGSTLILEKALRIRAQGGTGGRIKDRLEMMRQDLKQVPETLPDGHPDKNPRLLIDRTCTDLIEEMGDKYRYPENKSDLKDNPEEPLKKDDHGPEALGRFYAGHYGRDGRDAKGGTRGRARVSKANIRAGVR